MPWWAASLPLLIADIPLVVIDVISIIAMIKRSRQDRDLPPDERSPALPTILDCVNSILFVVATYMLVLRLDHALKTSLTVALIPYFIYSLKHLYMPFILYRQSLISRADAVNMGLSIIYSVTILLCCLKVDGISEIKWQNTFIFIWLFLAYEFIQELVLCLMASSIRVSVDDHYSLDSGSIVGGGGNEGSVVRNGDQVLHCSRHSEQDLGKVGMEDFVDHSSDCRNCRI